MKKICVTLFFSIAFLSVFSQTTDLRQTIQAISKDKKATIGVAVLHLETKDTITVNNTQHYPMQSVYKFHLALAVLHQIDEGKWTLDQKIKITKADLKPNTHSPLRDEHPEGDFYLSIGDLLSYTVSKSDNNGCNILFRLIGGTKALNAYLKSIGIQDISVKFTEEQMHKNWKNQYKNTTTPLAAVQLLDVFFNQNILSKSSRTFLWNTMAATSTGENKLKGLLPENTIVAHKTGSSDRNAKGVKVADNDMGIVTLPNRQHFAISVFVSNSMEDDQTNALIIAQLSKAVYDYYTSQISLEMQPKTPLKASMTDEEILKALHLDPAALQAEKVQGKDGLLYIYKNNVTEIFITRSVVSGVIVTRLKPDHLQQTWKLGKE